MKNLINELTNIENEIKGYKSRDTNFADLLSTRKKEYVKLEKRIEREPDEYIKISYQLKLVELKRFITDLETIILNNEVRNG